WPRSPDRTARCWPAAGRTASCGSGVPARRAPSGPSRGMPARSGRWRWSPPAPAPVRVAGRMLLASGGVDGTIQLVDPTTYRTESLLLAGASTVWALSSVALPDRTLLASGGVDGTMLLTNLDTRIVERS